MEIIKLKEDYIKLGQALKASGLVDSGVEAKFVIQDGLVLVNGNVELQRGKKLIDGDIVEFVANQDDVNFADNALWIMQDGNRISSLELTAGEAAELNVKGYPCSFYGTYGTEAIAAEYLAPVAGVQLGLMGEDGSVTAIDGAVCDGEGNVSLTLESAGEYVVVAFVPAGGEAVAFYSPMIVVVK